jgi:hypothetical protein
MDTCKCNPLWTGGNFLYHQVKQSKIPHYARSMHSFVFMDLTTNSCYSLVQNWLVFITEKGRVYLAVRTESVNIIHVNFLFSLASVIPQTLQTRLHLHVALTGWTKLPTSNALSEVGEFWVDKYFAFVNLQSRLCTMAEAIIRRLLIATARVRAQSIPNE